MSDESYPPSPNRALIALSQSDPEWQPVFHVSNQVVLYNPTSHALSIRHSSNFPERPRPPCPYCKQALPSDFEPEPDVDDGCETLDSDPAYHSRASDYFQLLAIANETSSRPSTPPPTESLNQGQRSAFPVEAMAEGYFKAFFQEEYKLGMGANGSVFLCQHMLDGNPLGHFAVKKIAVGESHSYLLKILREVRLLERLHHPNIITYHHAWLESCQFSVFGPKVPTLHVLMQWAEGGSLDDFIDVRLGHGTQHIHIDPVAPFSSRISETSIPETLTTPTLSSNASNSGTHSRSARIRAFRAFQRATPAERERIQRELDGARARSQRNNAWTAVHLLSAEEVNSLFKDVVNGLAFLHNKSILHLDLKPGNVLLTWDEGKLIPRAMLSDFGTSRDMMQSSRARSGNTGTLEYTSPESLPSPHTGLLQQIDSKADMWSLGMILHKLLFFKLPYRYASEGNANGEPISTNREDDKLDRLEKEVLQYAGFKFTPMLTTAFEARRLPRAYLVLLEGLLNVVPSGRPSCERVSSAIREGKLDPLGEVLANNETSSLIPITHRRSDAGLVDLNTSHSAETENGDHEPRETDSQQTTPKLTQKVYLLDSPTREYIMPPDAPLLGYRMSKIPWRRVFKSCILVAKVSSLMSICPNSGGPRLVVASMLLSTAILDTVLDGLWISGLLTMLHFGIIFGCSNNRCCN